MLILFCDENLIDPVFILDVIPLCDENMIDPCVYHAFIMILVSINRT